MKCHLLGMPRTPPLPPPSQRWGVGKGKGSHPEIVNKKSKGLDLGAEPPRMKSGVKRLVSTPVDGSYFYTTFLRSLPEKMRLAYRRRPSFCFTYMFKVNQRSRVVTESSGVMFDHFCQSDSQHKSPSFTVEYERDRRSKRFQI